MPELTLALCTVILLAWAFDFVNGFHDTANSIATVVSTRVLSPRMAVLMSASLNFLGAMVSSRVAKTIGKGIVDPVDITVAVLIAAVAAAILWDLFTWKYGLPSSSSHALVGGIVGATVVASGVGVLNAPVLAKVGAGLILSPVMGLLVAFFAMRLLLFLFAGLTAYVMGKWFRRLQLFSAGFMSFSHGENDAQMSMGIITAALVMSGHLQFAGGEFHIPVWVVMTCAAMIAFGTSVGGWRIIKTIGVRMLRLRPIDGFAGETSAALVIHGASRMGLPISTTHTITSALMGVGVSRRLSAVRWSVVRRIVLAWVFTLPMAALLGAVIKMILR